MKNGCSDILEAKISENSERAKKLYRYVNDVARRLGEATATSNTISDLFSTSLEVQRQKLRDNCEKLLFLDPLNHGKKSLELLWRKVYYDTVVNAKKLRESDNDNDSYLFTHIVCGIGQFHHFIDRIQTKIKVPFNELDYMLLNNGEESEDMVDTPNEEELQFGKSSLHSCLIYLGDLCRYQAEIFHTFEPSIAARYYLQAAHIDMSSGMPYNQLGNLYLDRNYNLDSVCYYIHCLSCAVPFEGALGNLTKIFDKTNQFFEASDDPQTLSQAEHIQNTIANFLSLIEIWYLNKSDTNISQRCNMIAQQLKIAMEFTMSPLPDINKNYFEYTQTIEEENINPSYLNGNLVHKIVQICLFTIAKLVETDEQKAFACKAFTMALLSQLLQKLLKQLASIGLQNPADNYKARNSSKQESHKINNKTGDLNLTDNKDLPANDEKIVNDEKDESSADIMVSKTLPNGETKNVIINNKKLLAKRRRRRRAASSESTDSSDEDTGSSEVDLDDFSSDEDLSDSTYTDEDDDKSEGSNFESSDKEVNGKINGIILEDQESKIVTNAESNNETATDQVQLRSDSDQIKGAELQNFLLGDNILPSIKLLQDWILTEKDLILSCGDSGESFFQCVVDLLNMFTFYFNCKTNNNTHEKCKVLIYAQGIAKNLKLEHKTIPLPEDINLRGTNICKFDKDAAEWQILDRYKPSMYEENIIRILDFIDFGTQIAKIVPRIRFNRTMKIYYLKRMPDPKLNTKNNHKRTREWHNLKKMSELGESGLLRRLGRLWLTSQVHELERSGRAAAASPALLAVDTAVLHTHLRRVKQLLRARNFILLVPTIVLQELDELKRELSGARDAIRWLEVQLRSGSRFLRTQRPGQSKPLPLLKYPRKAPPHIHNYIQILEFCNHFVSDEKQIEGGNGDADSYLQGKSTPILILLIGNEPGKDEEQYKEFSLTGAAQTAGISVEYIDNFYSKWRQSVHKSGKKR